MGRSFKTRQSERADGITRSAGCLPPDELADLLDGTRLADPPNLQSGDDLYIALIDIEPNIVPRLASGLQRQFLRLKTKQSPIPRRDLSM